MGFLFKESIGFAFLTTLLWPVAWLAIVGLMAIIWIRRRDYARALELGAAAPASWWLGLLAICPVTMLVLGEIFWERATPGASAYAVVYALNVLLALQILAAYLLAWRPPRRRGLAVIASSIGLLWGFGAHTVGGCAVTGAWP
jgi:hypothetical protein